MKLIIHYTLNNFEDQVEIYGDDIEDAYNNADAFFASRGLKEEDLEYVWSEKRE